MPVVAYMIRDMLFSSKLREAAKQVGVTTVSAPDPAALVKAAQAAQLVLLDLRLDRAIEALDALRADQVAARVPRIGFVDHERIEVMDLARAHGCAEVLTKGQFAGRLPGLFEALGRSDQLAAEGK